MQHPSRSPSPSCDNQHVSTHGHWSLGSRTVQDRAGQGLVQRRRAQGPCPDRGVRGHGSLVSALTLTTTPASVNGVPPQGCHQEQVPEPGTRSGLPVLALCVQQAAGSVTRSPFLSGPQSLALGLETRVRNVRLPPQPAGRSGALPAPPPGVPMDVASVPAETAGSSGRPREPVAGRAPDGHASGSRGNCRPPWHAEMASASPEGAPVPQASGKGTLKRHGGAGAGGQLPPSPPLRVCGGARPVPTSWGCPMRPSHWAPTADVSAPTVLGARRRQRQGAGRAGLPQRLLGCGHIGPVSASVLTWPLPVSV